MRITTLIILFSMISSVIYGQDKKLSVEIAAYGSGATDSLQPLWNYANKWGEFEHLTKGEGVFTGKISYRFLDKENVSMKAGLSGILKTNINKSFIQEAYLDMRFWWFDLTIGMEAYSPVSYDDELTSGMFLINSNARPIPRVTGGIFNYLPLGFTKNWVEIRGGMSQGWLNEDRGPKGNSNVLLHEKWAYMRIGNIKIQPYAGIVHSALFGGTKPDGTKIPIDFWATFTATGSDKIGGGEATNAAGAHMGMWDFGLYFPVKQWQAHAYYQKPFADGSGMNILHLKNKDYYLGATIRRGGSKAITGIAVEWIKTSWQSGPGTPDPYDPDEGHIVFIRDIEDVDAYMSDRFGIETDGWGYGELRDFLMDEWNHGYNFGGRDDYMNNGLYPAGWTYHGLPTGTPLYHTAQQVSQYAEGWNYQNRVIFINNRVNGFHTGIEGNITENIFYRFKGTYTKNKGNYGEEFHGRYSWIETDNYFFAYDKNQFYTNIELTWKFTKKYPLKLNTAIGYDFGDLYHSFGGRAGIIYSL
jgi:hypothetical protein